MLNKKSLIIAISGASGAIYGIRLLELLKTLAVDTHLIISKAAALTIISETDYSVDQVRQLTSYNYNYRDIACLLPSGSFQTDGMIIAPCSMKTLGLLAASIEDNLIIRSANVILKEQKKLVLLCRESPLHSGYLENMLTLSKRGAIISPPVPAFYNKPKTIDDIVNHTIGRILDLFNIDANIVKRWRGL